MRFRVKPVPARVLIVEDLAINQRVALGLLSRRGHAVTVVNNGKEALAALEADRFDVVLMDVQMPEMDGFEATARIRERERATGDHIRIVAVTAHAMIADRGRCLASGMDEYLSKPLNPTALYEAIEGPAGRHGGARTVAPNTVIDWDDMLHRLCNDEQLVAEVIALFVEECPTRLAAIKAAVGARDAERIRTTAHALKGSAANLSARGIVSALQELEHISLRSDLTDIDTVWARVHAEGERVLALLRPIALQGSACAS